MDGKVLREFPDGSKIIDNGGGKLLFFIDIGKVDERQLEHMIPRLKTEISKMRTKDEIWRGVHKIGESWAGVFDRDADKKIQANLYSFMGQLMRDQRIAEFHINPVTYGRSTIHYKLMNTPEHVQLDFAISHDDSIERLMKALPDKETMQELAGCSPAKAIVDAAKSICDAIDKDIVDSITRAAIRPHAYPTRQELFEAYHKYGPEMLDKYLPMSEDKVKVRKEFDDVIKYVAPDQRAGYMAKGYGCKDRDRCIAPHPHHTTDCVFDYGWVKLREPLKQLSAKEICETQPMMKNPLAVDEDFIIENKGFKIVPKAPIQWEASGNIQVASKVETTTSPMAALRAQRKKDGVCPECGDIKRESAVGVCRDHGKFMG